MKKLLSFLLAFLLLAGLCVPVLASGEFIDEPEIITEPGLEEDPAAELSAEEQEPVEEPEPAENSEPAEDLEAAEEPEAPEQDTEPAPAAEEPVISEADVSSTEGLSPDEPAPDENLPAEIEFIPDGKSGNGKALQLTAGDIAGAQQSNVYFGNYVQSGSGKDPVKWWVLENDGNQLFLLSEQNLDAYRYHNTETDITWAQSDIRAWLNDTVNGFAGDAFSAGELAAIPQTDVVNDNNPEYGTAGGENTKDRVFLLSIAEATNTAYGFTDNYDNTDTREATNTAYVASGGKTGTSLMSGAGKIDLWWLRSPGYSQSSAAFVNSIGNVISYGGGVYNFAVAVRPAFKINLSSVLFTSAAEGGKISAAPGGASSGGEANGTYFSQIESYSGTDWKLTLKDESRRFAVSETAVTAAPGGTVALTYSGATEYTAPNEYISAIITDSAGEPLYYGRLIQPTTAGGTLTITSLPLEEGTYTLKLFSEQYNGDYRTDYASDFCDVTLTVRDDIPAPQPAVTLSSDAATAQAENFAGLYARVAIVIDINGVSGLFVVQPTINADGTIVIPSITMPGLTVKGVSVALVPTLADIQKSMPEVKASDMRMLG